MVFTRKPAGNSIDLFLHVLNSVLPAQIKNHALTSVVKQAASQRCYVIIYRHVASVAGEISTGLVSQNFAKIKATLVQIFTQDKDLKYATIPSHIGSLVS